MRHTFHISTNQLNEKFIESIRSLFSYGEIKVTVEDITGPTVINQVDLVKETVGLIERFKDVSIDSNLDLSALANEVNL